MKTPNEWVIEILPPVITGYSKFTVDDLRNLINVVQKEAFNEGIDTAIKNAKIVEKQVVINEDTTMAYYTRELLINTEELEKLKK